MKDGVQWQDIPSPDWTIVGAPYGDGVVLLASRHLTGATLQAVAKEQIPLQAMTLGWMRTGVFLSLHVGVDDYVMVTGPDYPSAFAFLFRQWSPDDHTIAISAGEEVIDGELE